uniref:aldo/keto reductase n=1 Tax=Mariniflexile sp. TaxID=1979402 RepID=UPI0040473089
WCNLDVWKLLLLFLQKHSVSKLKAQWKISKSLLPFLTTYQIHSATLETGVLENTAVLKELAYLKSAFNLKMGISTTGVNQVEVIKKALDVTVEGTPVFDTFQSTYNILDQTILEVGALLKQENKKLIIKEALANGRVFRNKNYPEYNDLYKTLESLSKKYGVGVDAVALRFCAKTMPESMVLSGASTVCQLRENLKMDAFALTGEELNRLQSFGVKPETYWNERKQLKWN